MSLEQLKQKIFAKTVSPVTSFFYLIKELGVADLVTGKEYEGEIVIKGEKCPFKFSQKPMSISQLNVLLRELELHYQREEKSNKRKR